MSASRPSRAALGGAPQEPTAGRVDLRQRGRPGLRGTRTVLSLLTRRFALPVASSLLVLWSLIAVTPASHERIYPDAASRQVIVSLASDSPALTVFMGRLPAPGNLGQFFVWETGAYILWCTALLAVLLTASTTRGDEQSGLVELAHGAGAGRWTPLVAPALWVAALLAVLSAGAGLILTAVSLTVEEMSVAGTWVYAALLAVVGLVFEALVLVLAQLFREPTAVRGVGLALFAGAFALRALADVTGASWLRWFTPLAWRDLVDPYGADDVRVLGLGLCVGLVTGGLAACLHVHRDVGGAYLPERSAPVGRRRVRGQLDLLARLGARATAWWLVSVSGIAVLFTGMGSMMTDALEVSPDAAQTLTAIAGAGGIAATYLRLTAEFTVLLIVVAVILRALGAVRDERDGLAEVVLAQGVSRSRWYWARVADAALLGLVGLVVAAAATAAVAGSQFPGERAAERAWAYTLSQGAGTLAVLGVVFCLVGLVPRLSGLSWVVVAWSAFTVFLGGLLRVPQALLEVSVLGHVVEVGADTDWVALLVQVAVGVLGLLAGWWGLRRRPRFG